VDPLVAAQLVVVSERLHAFCALTRLVLMDVPVVLDHVSPVQKRPVASLDQAFVHQARLRV
jgi:hypothetical protein